MRILLYYMCVLDICDCVVIIPQSHQQVGLTHVSSFCICAADGLELMVLTVRQPFSKQQALMAQATVEYCTWLWDVFTHIV